MTQEIEYQSDFFEKGIWEGITVIPVYNMKRHRIARCLQSIADNFYQPSQILLVDDHSDNVFLHYYQDEIAEYIMHHNLNISMIHVEGEWIEGAAPAYEAGTKYAVKHGYKYLNFLGGDDTLKNGYYKSIADFFERDWDEIKEIAWVSTQTELHHEFFEEAVQVEEDSPGCWNVSILDKFDWPIGAPLHPEVIMKDVVHDIGYEKATIKLALYCYYHHEDNISHDEHGHLVDEENDYKKYYAQWKEENNRSSLLKEIDIDEYRL